MLKRATFKHIEAELYAFPDTKREINKLREQIMAGSPNDDENVGAGANSVRVASRPTEMIASRLVTNKQLRNLEEIVEAIESVYERLDEIQQKLVTMRYWSKKSKYSWERIAIECNMSESTVYRTKNAIVKMIADKVGWR